MRCLITGVAGFIGSHLADRLLKDGHEVCGLDAFIDYYPRYIKERNLETSRAWRHFTFIEGNLLNLNLPPLLEGVDWIFHQAAQAGVLASWGKYFSRYVVCNVLATQRLLDAALKVNNLQCFVNASSSSIYGETTALPIVESTIPQPVSPYGVTKLAAEHLCMLYYRNFGLPTVSLRYFTVYGPRQRPDMAFHRFCKAILQHQPIQIYDDGQQTRDFTYISDVIEANIRAATTRDAIGQVMNIAGGSRVSTVHVLQLLREITGIPMNLTFETKQFGDVRDTFADIRLSKQVIEYHPTITIREGLKLEFEYIQSLYA
jgi:nucleoside-diphosphate-sugar epimerase